MKEQLISFETAKLAKVKKFNKPESICYEDGTLVGDGINAYQWNKLKKCFSKVNEPDVKLVQSKYYFNFPIS